MPWTIIDQGPPRHDVAAMIKALQTDFPASKRSAGGVLKLLVVTEMARKDVLKRVVTEKDIEASQRKRLVTDLTRFRSRLQAYARFLARVDSKGPPPPEVTPFLHSIPALPHFTPDWLTPYTVDNQLQALEVHRDTTQSFLETFFEEAASFPPVKAVVTVASNIEKATQNDSWKWFLGGALLIGTSAYFYVKGARS